MSLVIRAMHVGAQLAFFSLWDGAIHTQDGSSLLCSVSLEITPQTHHTLGVLADGKSNLVDNGD